MATLSAEYSDIQDDSDRLIKALRTFGQSSTEAANGGPTDKADQDDDDEQDDEHDEIQVAGSSKQASTSTKKVSEPPTKPKPKNIKNLLRSSKHVVKLENGSEHVLTSWKMADYAYKRDPCPFPTRARGLFTETTPSGKNRIVCRAYDKFFNVNEVSWTKWENISSYSSPPYELTRKSNGCIILIAALTETDLIVTSKHSIGENKTVRTESGLSHAQRGEEWLMKHLEKAGKTKRELANALWTRNMTAVAELCDDSFEEHVLPYGPHETGLHLHGLVLNLPTLYSLPSEKVSAFAKEWGMIPTAFLVFPSVEALRTYCSNVEKMGGVEEQDEQGRRVSTPVEGFVARGKRKGATKEGDVFMWKVKYDEPYLMYREWRELTRKILAAKGKEDTPVNVSRLKNKESRLYAWWVEREIRRDPDRFESWKYGKGMIKTREEFLAWKETPEGKQQANKLGLQGAMAKLSLNDERDVDKRPFEKTLIVPIAVPGCGKTKVALELADLFGWGHTQSDDFLVKKPAPHFLKAIKDGLQSSKVWIADKNNHTVKHRQDLIDLARSLPVRVRLVALVWSLDGPRDTLHSLLAKRIEQRGSNHQTLRAGEGHEAVLWQFLSQYEAFDPVVGADASFDDHFKIDPAWSRERALDQILNFICPIVQVERPSDDAITKSIAAADAYVPKNKKVVSEKEKEKLKARMSPRYYGLSVDVDLASLLEPVFARVPEDEKALWKWLVLNDRVEKKPHITLVHEVELSQPDEVQRAARKALWDRYESLLASSSDPVKVGVKLGPRIAYDDKVVSIEAFVEPDERIEAAKRHVTAGYAEGSRPVEGKLIFEAVHNGSERPGLKVVELDEAIHVTGILKGLR